MRFKILAVLTALALAPPLTAQTTAAEDTAHWRASRGDIDSVSLNPKLNLRSKRALARLRLRDSSLVYKLAPPAPIVANVDIHSNGTTVAVGASLQLTADAKKADGTIIPGVPIVWSTPTPDIADVSAAGLLTGRKVGLSRVSARAGTASAERSYTVFSSTPPVPPDTTAPADSLPPIPPSGASIAAQPVNVPTAKYPACTTTVQVLAGTNLQAAINSAQSGTCLLLAPNARFVGNFQLPNRSSSGYVTVTTGGFVSQPGTRMTPTKAVPLAKILSPNYTEAIGTAPGAHGYIFRGVEIAPDGSAGSAVMNVVVRLTDPTNAAPPSDIQFQQVYVHGTPTADIRRAFRADGRQMVLIDSWGDEIHSNNSDSQLWLAISCAQGHLVQNNTLKAGHEIVMFGGGDPPNAGCIPQDIVLRQNHIYHPVAWYKVWQVKNCIETKNVIRYVIEANVIENCWPDAQAGFAFVMKSENQDGSAPYTTTSDVTIRYNKVNCAGNGFNLSGKGSLSNPNVVSSRYDINNNVFTNYGCQPGGQAIEVQLLSGVTDVQLQKNSFFGKDLGGSAMSLDGAPAAVRLVVKNTAMHSNAYGVKGTGLGIGTASLNGMAPGYVWNSNLLVGNASCGSYPATTTCSSSWPALPTAAYGADTALVNSLTKGVVVNDPLVASLARRGGPRPVLRFPWTDSPAACKVVGKTLPPYCDRGIQ